MEKKEAERSRKIQIKLYIAEKEKRAIRQRMNEAGMKNFSRYARLMLLYGHINKVDVDEIRETRIALNRIGTNLNQIAKRVNESDEASTDDLGNALAIMKEIKQIVNNTLNKKLDEDDSSSDVGSKRYKGTIITVDDILSEQFD